MDKKIILYTPAKVNLFLEIVGKEKNYHLLNTLVQTVDLYDRLEIKSLPSLKKVEVKTDKLICPLHDNLVYKAAKYFLEYYRINEGVEIFLKKNIPIGAGLGGGSSDAAATLVGLSILFRKRKEKKNLHYIGNQLGSDVPLFLKGGLCFCKGRGVEVKKLKKKYKKFFLLIDPKVHCDTSYVYKNFKLDLTSLRQWKYNKIELFNRLEETVLKLYGKLRMIKERLVEEGIDIYLTGSGSNFFKVFNKRKEAEDVKEKIQKIFPNLRYFICKSCDGIKVVQP